MRKNHGFTIIELIIYIAIFGMIVVGLISFALSVTTARAKTYASTEVEANGRIALAIVRGKVRAATAVTASGSVFNADPGVLRLQMPDGSVTIIDLDANDGRLRIKEGNAAPLYITSRDVKVTNLIFENLSQAGEREEVNIYLTLSYGTRTSADYSYTWSGRTAVGVRQ